MTQVPGLTTWRWLLTASLVSSACALVACGGGGGSGGGTTTSASPTPPAPASTPTPPASAALYVGTVNGFGSVFIDGTRCDDTGATVSVITYSGGPDPQNRGVKLGHRIESDNAASAPASGASTPSCKLSAIRIEPGIVGKVSALSPLTVAGQVVTVNTDAAQGPVTVFEGLTSAADIVLGDRLEVHGQLQGSGASATWLATRIERLSQPATNPATWVRVGGSISELSASQFKLAGLTVKYDGTTKIEPAGSQLANGQAVAVWSASALNNDGTLTAKAIRLRKKPAANQDVLHVEGKVADCPASGSCTTFKLDGMAIDITTAKFSSGALADVSNGRYVGVEGPFNSTTQTLTATEVNVRKGETASTQVQLIGVVNNYVSNASFSVRDTPVTTDANTQWSNGCTLSDGQAVTVKGKAQSGQVLATQVTCNTLAEGLTVEVRGFVAKWDAGKLTFGLNEGPFANYTFTVNADKTVFRDLKLSDLLNGVHIEVKGYIQGNTVVVTQVTADPVPNAPGVKLLGLSGKISAITETTFTVNGQVITRNGNTQFVDENGKRFTEPLSVGLKVKVWMFKPATDNGSPLTALLVVVSTDS